MQISSEDAGNFSEFSNPQTPPLSRGAADDVKLELQRAIRCRRVAQGLEEMPSLDSQRSNSNQVTYTLNIYIFYFAYVKFVLCSYRVYITSKAGVCHEVQYLPYMEIFPEYTSE